MSREEATTAILVFCDAVSTTIMVRMKGRGGNGRADHDETDHGDDGHEDAWTFS